MTTRTVYSNRNEVVAVYLGCVSHQQPKDLALLFAEATPYSVGTMLRGARIFACQSLLHLMLAPLFCEAFHCQ